jgi:hypothetical protein
MPHFMNIGGVLVNLDNVNYLAQSPKNPACLEIHFGNEVANIDKFSVEEMTTILNALTASQEKMPYNRPPPMP